MIDFAQVKDLAAKAVAESSFNNNTIDIPKVLQYLNHKDVFVKTWGTPIHGIFIGCINRPWFSNDIHATDLLLYVMPEYRGKAGKVVKSLLEFERWAKDKGCNQLRTYTTYEGSSDIADKLYNRLGYSRMGSCFRKDI
jgi:GNAT superfamily N-acetyltransferase